MATSGDNRPVWEVKAAEKRAECQRKIPKEWQVPQSVWKSLPTPLEKNKANLIELDIVRKSGLLTERELDITEKHNVPSLLEKLAKGELTSLEVTTAFSKRAAIAEQLTNCLTETFFDQAQERARELDSMREKGQPLGPLHGLPISLKDSYKLVGVASTLGLTAYLDKIATENSVLVDILYGLGAVLYVKTNIPQMMMSADSENIIFGRTLNPWNTMLTAGGSSGGEGALVAFRGSPLGVGTDIAGSIRIPSLCCGLYGFKPTSNRVPFGRKQGCHSLISSVGPTAGPMTNDVHALTIFYKAVMEAHPAKYDASAIDVPYRDVKAPLKPKLRLGMVLEDPVHPLHPPVKAALEEAVSLVKAQGHEIIPIPPNESQIAYGHDVLWKFFSLDNTARDIVAKGGEPIIESSNIIQKELRALGSRSLPGFEDMAPLEKISALNIAKADYMEHWREVWETHKLDGVIGPGAQNTAVEHDLYALVPYTGFLNLLDYPSCILPFKKATAFPPFEKAPGQSMPTYNPELFEGAPCSIQVFTTRMRDEECLAVAKTVDDCLRAR